MASINSYRRKWLKWLSSYEKRSFTLLSRMFRDLANDIPFSDLNEDNYRDLVEESVDLDKMIEVYSVIYEKIGLVHGKRVGDNANNQVKLFSLESFTSEYLNNILLWLRNEGGNRITLVRKTFINDIINIISSGLEEGESIQTISKELQEAVNKRSFYRWQAERIARTESTSAANRAAIIAVDDSEFFYEKVWISAQDKRTRRTPPDKFDHLDMDGVRVGLHEDFIVSDEALSYPGDPDGSAGNVINCRCTIAAVVKRDENGRPIRKE